MQNSSSKSALLVMDMQNSVVSRFVDSYDALLPFQKAIEAARSHEIPIIYVRVAFRAGYPRLVLETKCSRVLPVGPAQWWHRKRLCKFMNPYNHDRMSQL